jgi:predicted SnoaL-like aldol condensation-catalyzing enzyme
MGPEDETTLGPADVVARTTEAFNAGDFDSALQWMADHAVNHGPPATDGLDAWRQTWIASRTAFPDMRAYVEQVVEQGDMVCRRLRIMGTSAPTGRQMDVLGMDMVRVADGKVVEHWAFVDVNGMADQLRDGT